MKKTILVLMLFCGSMSFGSYQSEQDFTCKDCCKLSRDICCTCSECCIVGCLAFGLSHTYYISSDGTKIGMPKPTKMK